MPFPAGWPPRPSPATASLRFYVTDVATANFSDKAYLFGDQAGAFPYKVTPYVAPGSVAAVQVGDTTVSGSPMGGGTDAHDAAPPNHQNPPATQQAVPPRMAWSGTILVRNEGAGAMEISFDGVTVHGYLASGTERVYRQRHEAGIAVRGVGGATPTYRIEAW